MSYWLLSGCIDHFNHYNSFAYMNKITNPAFKWPIFSIKQHTACMTKDCTLPATWLSCHQWDRKMQQERNRKNNECPLATNFIELRIQSQAAFFLLPFVSQPIVRVLNRKTAYRTDALTSCQQSTATVKAQNIQTKQNYQTGSFSVKGILRLRFCWPMHPTCLCL